MKKFILLTKRNMLVYFSDKTMFLTSLITPLILLVLFATFLGNVYKNSFIGMFPEEIEIPSKIINGLVSGQLLASLISVSCITVSFSSNLLMVQDKVSGAYKDIDVSPVNKRMLSLSYFTASFLSTIIINFFALLMGIIYIWLKDWYLSFSSILMISSNVIILPLFGTALSSIINFYLKSQGQITAVSTIISSGYGFICGAYMPISSFGKGLQKVLSFLPSTYGTSLVKTSCLRDIFIDLKNYVPNETITIIKESIDSSIKFLGHNVSTGMMYLIMITSVILLISIFVLQNVLRKD